MITTISSRIRSAGGGFVATIPKDVVEREGFRAGEPVVLTLKRREEAWEELSNLLRDFRPWDRRSEPSRTRY